MVGQTGEKGEKVLCLVVDLTVCVKQHSHNDAQLQYFFCMMMKVLKLLQQHYLLVCVTLQFEYAEL